MRLSFSASIRHTRFSRIGCVSKRKGHQEACVESDPGESAAAFGLLGWAKLASQLVESSFEQSPHRSDCHVSSHELGDGYLERGRENSTRRQTLN